MQVKNKNYNFLTRKDVIVFNYYTHIFMGILVGYGLDYILWDFGIIEMSTYYLFLIIGSLLPDIDTPKSFIGSKIKPLSNLIYNIFGHRGITHNLLFVNGLFLVSIVILGINIISIALFIGCIVHILGDKLSTFTKSYY